MATPDPDIAMLRWRAGAAKEKPLCAEGTVFEVARDHKERQKADGIL